jgi:hypothetical protein
MKLCSKCVAAIRHLQRRKGEAKTLFLAKDPCFMQFFGYNELHYQAQSSVAEK